MTREHVLNVLQKSQNQFVSGESLAAQLRISRTAVWKAVEQLRGEGYPIVSVPRRGHMLPSGADVLSAEGIRRYLKHPEIEVRFFPVISSTNTVLKQLAAENAPAGLALVAGEQTSGRGRMGRSFYSPAGSGLYLSLLLRPDLEPAKAVMMTACAAVSVAEAIETLTDVRLGIKWVNDLFLRGKKVCGILTEAGLDCEAGRMSYVVIGVGINTRIPAENFPEDIRETAGSVFGETSVPDLRNRLAALVLDNLVAWSADPGSVSLFENYRRRSLALGRPIRILAPGRDPVQAEVLDIDPDYSLKVRLEDGSIQHLCSGEISIRYQSSESFPR